MKDFFPVIILKSFVHYLIILEANVSEDNFEAVVVDLQLGWSFGKSLL